jgi:hypothetical protein
MGEPGWFEVTAVVRATPELLAQARSALDDSGLAELDTWEVTPLDEHRCRWDGSSPSTHTDEQTPASVLIGMPEPGPTAHPVFDRLRRGHHIDRA